MSNKIYDFLTNPKVVKISIIIAFITVFSALIIGYIIAALFGSQGYNMIDNYISDMGSIKYTPFPYMRTIANVVSGPFFLPITFYMKKQLASSEDQNISRGRLFLGNIGFAAMLVIFLGMVCTGIITEDVSMLIHIIIAIIAISAGWITIFSYSILIIKYQTEIHKNIGLYGLISLPTILILVIIGFPSRIFYEWVYLLSFYFWLILCARNLLIS
ncbi:MAG: DUF998 domain-containing protein [Promethearchaeota archaeon]